MRLVVKEKDRKTVSIDKINENKIYAFVGMSDIYKLHRVNTEEHPVQYAFIGLSESRCFANGVFKSMKDAIDYCIAIDNKVYEFDDPVDFCQWALNEYRQLRFNL